MDMALVCKAIASVAMAGAVGAAAWKTENANCLWALFFISAIWGG